MAGFIDVLLRGLILVATSVTLGGAAWLLLVRRVEPHLKPDRATRRALRLAAAGALTAAVAQAAVMAVAAGALAAPETGWPIVAYAATTFARVAALRVLLGLVLGALALALARRPAGAAAWAALGAGAVGLVALSAVLSHAIARVDTRPLLVALDAVHQIAAAIWVGGLAHLTLHGARRVGDTDGPEGGSSDDGVLIRRFSTLALGSVVVLTVAGTAMTWFYVGDPAALVGTAYGVMVLSKVALFVTALGLAAANFGLARRIAGAPPVRLSRYVEVELGLGVTILFVAASLTSLPPAVDVTSDRATVPEVAARFVPGPPRLTSPPITELLRTAEPLMEKQTTRLPIERAWSEYNHHWAGLFVLAMGLLAALERLGVRAARHWPLVFLGLAGFLFARNDPRAWPLGPAGFWESMWLPDVLQHRAFVLLVVAFAVFEWTVRTGRLSPRPWVYVFPLLCAAAGGLLLTHSHAMFSLRDQFLVEVTHAPIGILGVFAGWGRWLELRLPQAGRGPGWIPPVCFSVIGLLLLFYRED
ncbi:MAG: copper resistance D family protein [Candidatus Rokuibacteriota bacterium]